MQNKQLVNVGLPAVLIVVGIVLIVMHAMEASEAARSLGWQQAKATIEKAGAGSKEPLDIAYRYKYAGQEYRSQKVSLGKIEANGVRARLARYQTGRTVLAYVNPKNPSEAVLEQAAAPPKARMLTGWGLIYVGTAGGLLLWRNSQKVKKKRRIRRPTQTQSVPRTTMSRPPTMTKTKRPTPPVKRR